MPERWLVPARTLEGQPLPPPSRTGPDTARTRSQRGSQGPALNSGWPLAAGTAPRGAAGRPGLRGNRNRRIGYAWAASPTLKDPLDSIRLPHSNSTMLATSNEPLPGLPRIAVADPSWRAGGGAKEISPQPACPPACVREFCSVVQLPHWCSRRPRQLLLEPRRWGCSRRLAGTGGRPGNHPSPGLPWRVWTQRAGRTFAGRGLHPGLGRGR